MARSILCTYREYVDTFACCSNGHMYLPTVSSNYLNNYSLKILSSVSSLLDFGKKADHSNWGRFELSLLAGDNICSERVVWVPYTLESMFYGRPGLRGVGS